MISFQLKTSELKEYKELIKNVHLKDNFIPLHPTTNNNAKILLNLMANYPTSEKSTKKEEIFFNDLKEKKLQIEDKLQLDEIDEIELIVNSTYAIKEITNFLKCFPRLKAFHFTFNSTKLIESALLANKNTISSVNKISKNSYSIKGYGKTLSESLTKYLALMLKKILHKCKSLSKLCIKKTDIYSYDYQEQITNKSFIITLLPSVSSVVNTLIAKNFIAKQFNFIQFKNIRHLILQSEYENIPPKNIATLFPLLYALKIGLSSNKFSNPFSDKHYSKENSLTALLTGPCKQLIHLRKITLLPFPLDYYIENFNDIVEIITNLNYLNANQLAYSIKNLQTINLNYENENHDTYETGFILHKREADSFKFEHFRLYKKYSIFNEYSKEIITDINYIEKNGFWMNFNLQLLFFKSLYIDLILPFSNRMDATNNNFWKIIYNFCCFYFTMQTASNGKYTNAFNDLSISILSFLFYPEQIVHMLANSENQLTFGCKNLDKKEKYTLKKLSKLMQAHLKSKEYNNVILNQQKDKLINAFDEKISFYRLYLQEIECYRSFTQELSAKKRALLIQQLLSNQSDHKNLPQSTFLKKCTLLYETYFLFRQNVSTNYINNFQNIFAIYAIDPKLSKVTDILLKVYINTLLLTTYAKANFFHVLPTKFVTKWNQENHSFKLALTSKMEKHLLKLSCKEETINCYKLEAIQYFKKIYNNILKQCAENEILNSIISLQNDTSSNEEFYKKNYGHNDEHFNKIAIHFSQVFDNYCSIFNLIKKIYQDFKIANEKISNIKIESTFKNYINGSKKLETVNDFSIQLQELKNKITLVKPVQVVETFLFSINKMIGVPSTDITKRKENDLINKNTTFENNKQKLTKKTRNFNAIMQKLTTKTRNFNTIMQKLTKNKKKKNIEKKACPAKKFRNKKY